jgi:hypothetical protein
MPRQEGEMPEMSVSLSDPGRSGVEQHSPAEVQHKGATVGANFVGVVTRVTRQCESTTSTR